MNNVDVDGTPVFLKGENVDLGRADTEVVAPILEAAADLYADTPQRLVVTSAAEGEPGDGVHSWGSLHYPQNTPEGRGGWALDLRIWNLPDPAETANALQRRLGVEYDVVYGPQHDTHIHVEYDPPSGE